MLGELQKRYKESGFSLLEILLASLLGSFVLVFFVLLCSSLDKSLNEQKAWSDIQQRGRFLVYFFNQILSRAGIEECSADSVNRTLSKIQVRGFMEKNKAVITIYHCLPLKGKEIFAGVDYFLENNRLYFKPKNNLHAKRLLMQEIQEMKIEYGVTCNQEKVICDYLSTSKVQNWEKVRSVSLEFLIASGKLKKKWFVYVALPERH